MKMISGKVTDEMKVAFDVVQAYLKSEFGDDYKDNGAVFEFLINYYLRQKDDLYQIVISQVVTGKEAI